MASYLANALFFSVKENRGEAAAIEVMQLSEKLRNMSAEEIKVIYSKPRGGNPALAKYFCKRGLYEN